MNMSIVDPGKVSCSRCGSSRWSVGTTTYVTLDLGVGEVEDNTAGENGRAVQTTIVCASCGRTARQYEKERIMATDTFSQAVGTEGEGVMAGIPGHMMKEILNDMDIEFSGEDEGEEVEGHKFVAVN